jgi:catalase
MNHGQFYLAPQLVDLIHKNFGGFHAGYRGVHAVGRYYAGTFTATPEAKKISRAAHLQGNAVPVTVRHSINVSADPLSGAGAPSMATKFFLPDGTVTDLIGLILPVFLASTPEEVVGFLTAKTPDPVTGEMNKERVMQFLGEHPNVAQAVQLALAVKLPKSLAQARFNAFHAFRFVNEANEGVYARYHWQPEAGIASLTIEELNALGPHYLYEEYEERMAKAPVVFHLVLTLAGEGDTLVDPCTAWPEGRSEVVIGRLELTRPTTIEEIGDPIMLHDPTRVTDGIEVSDDPILAARRGVYEVSVAHRTGGWKGKEAALERMRCPFGS